MNKDDKNRGDEIKRALQYVSLNSTIAGLHYAFEPNLSKLGRFIWLLSILVLTGFFISVSVRNYDDWSGEPVTSALTSIGLQIGKVPFPSVVICSNGIRHEAVKAAFVKLVFDFVNETTGKPISESPIDLIKFRENQVGFKMCQKLSYFHEIIKCWSYLKIFQLLFFISFRNFRQKEKKNSKQQMKPIF